jgi:Peptidase propeptide and YPEB domain
MTVNLMDRRRFLALMLAVLATGAATPALAKDGGGSGGGGSGGGGSGGGGSGGSGSGGGDDDNSGSGGGGGGGDDDDDDEDDDNSGSGNSGRGRGGSREADRARKLVRSGKAMPLKAAMERVQKYQDGRIIDAKLKKSSGRLVYEFKVLLTSGNVRKVRMDAVTGRFSGFLGF